MSFCGAAEGSIFSGRLEAKSMNLSRLTENVVKAANEHGSPTQFGLAEDTAEVKGDLERMSVWTENERGHVYPSAGASRVQG